jgi:hypothetical protein
MALSDILIKLFSRKKTLADLSEQDLKDKLYGVETDRDALKAEINGLKEKIAACYEDAVGEDEQLEGNNVIEIERLENKRDAALTRFERATQDIMVLDELIKIQKDKKLNRITNDLKTIDLAKVQQAVDKATKEGEMSREKLRELLNITAEGRQAMRERSPRQGEIKETIARARRLKESGKDAEAKRLIREASRSVRRREAEEI